MLNREKTKTFVILNDFLGLIVLNYYLRFPFLCDSLFISPSELSFAKDDFNRNNKSKRVKFFIVFNFQFSVLFERQ